MSVMPADPIPVVVLSGFLGSGKTTRLARAVRDPRFARTAVVINEFGAIGLDHELVAAGDDRIIEVATGCLCCTVRSSLAETIADLLARRDDRRAAFDRIVIETSGLADPAQIVNLVAFDRALSGAVRVAGVVVTVDAVNGQTVLERHAEAARQVASADRLVLTKLDLAAPSAELLAALHAINPDAAADLDRDDEVSREDVLLADDAGGIAPIFRAEAAGAPGGASGHPQGIESISLIYDAALPAPFVPLFLEALIAHAGERLMRAKGLVNIAESPESPLVVHVVGGVVQPVEWLAGWPSTDRRTRIVVIGRGISRKWLELLFDLLLDEVRQAGQA